MEGLIIKKDFGKKAWAFAIFSLVVHLAFLISKVPSFSFENALMEKEKSRLIVRLATVEKIQKKNQVVETQKSDEKLPKPKRAFLGKQNNTFSRETKAAKSGSFKEAGKGARQGHKKLAEQIEKSLKNQKLKNLKFSDLAAQTSYKKTANKKSKKPSNTVAKGLENGRANQIGLSRSSDFLEEVPLGDFTRLNTQEYEFYGFYHRIRQKLEQFWGANLQEQMEKIYKSGRTIASGQNLLTSLVIQMNRQGEIVNIQLGSTSGIKELDDVAIDSFNQAGPFPNPPKGMLKGDLATIKWGFAVEAN